MKMSTNLQITTKQNNNITSRADRPFGWMSTREVFGVFAPLLPERCRLDFAV